MAQLIKNNEKQKIIGAKKGDVVYVNDDGNLVGGPAPAPAVEDLAELIEGQGGVIVDVSTDGKKLVVSNTDVDYVAPQEFDDILLDETVNEHVIYLFDGSTGFGEIKFKNPEKLVGALHHLYFIGSMQGFEFAISFPTYSLNVMANGESPSSLTADGAIKVDVFFDAETREISVFPNYFNA